MSALSQGEIEEWITTLADELEDLTDQYRECCDDQAEAEVTYKVRNAKAFLAERRRRPEEGERAPSEKVCDAQATVATENELRAYKTTSAMKDSCKTALVTKQARLDAYRTLAANVRRQT